MLESEFGTAMIYQLPIIITFKRHLGSSQEPWFLGNHLCLVHEETWPWKEFKGRMLPSAPSSALTVTSSMPLWCGSFSCNTVRILVLPSGSVLLLMLATDFDLEMVENDCLRNSVLFEVPWRSPLCCPWRSALFPWRLSVFSPWRSSEWSWKGGWLHAVCTFGCRVASRSGLMWLTFALVPSGCAAGLSVPPLLTAWTYIEYWSDFCCHICDTFCPMLGILWVGEMFHTYHISYPYFWLFGLDLSFAWRSWSHLLWLTLQLLRWTCVIGSPLWLPRVAWHTVIICQRWLFCLELSVILPTFWLQSVFVTWNSSSSQCCVFSSADM